MHRQIAQIDGGDGWVSALRASHRTQPAQDKVAQQHTIPVAISPWPPSPGPGPILLCSGVPASS
eukprot:2605313-Rhodomonas_salina.3